MDRPGDHDDDPTRSGVDGPERDLSTWSELTRDHGDPTAVPVPEWIGEFEILGRLGEGGMGVVYEAVQQNPHRRVALKVIRGGAHLDEAHLRMFEREADTLGRLKHPHIAAIYASGYTEEGFPYYAMELVRGVSLDRFIDMRPERIDPTELRTRLAMFRKICDAVHYAHQRGVIHRDLKPSNILITDLMSDGIESLSGLQVPEPKVLDFGLARLTDADPNASMATEVGVLKGTLFYMSPEQAQGLPDQIDLRTDVYALGVILYEVLTGRLPYDFDRTTLMDAVQKIVHQSPEPLRKTWSGTRKLDRDLETIVGKALEKEPDRRYGSAAALSEDLHRYMTALPILARPPSTTYQLRKFAQRNKILVGGIVATFLTLVGGVVVSTNFGLQEARQRREVERTKAQLESVAAFQSEMLRRLDPEATGREMLGLLREDLRTTLADRIDDPGVLEAMLAEFERTLGSADATDLSRHLLDRQLLMPTEAAIESSFADQPEVAARLYVTVGSTLRALGLYARSEAACRRAVELYEGSLGPDDPKTAFAVLELGDTLRRLRRLDDARPLYERALGIIRRERPVTPAALFATYRYGVLLMEMRELDEARVQLETTLTAQRETLGEDHADALRTLNALAGIHQRTGRPEDAEPLFREVLERRLRTVGERDPNTIAAGVNLGNVLLTLEATDEALNLVAPFAETAREVLGGTHPTTLRALAILANCHRETGRDDDAIRILRSVVAHWERDAGPLHPRTLDALNSLGYSLAAMDKPDEATEVFETLLERDLEVYPQDHPRFAVHRHSYAEAMMAGEDWRSARQMLEIVLPVYRATEDRYLGLALYQHAQACARLGDLPAALESLRGSIDARHVKKPGQLDDPAFAGLRDDPAFAALRARLSTVGTGTGTGTEAGTGN